jgi:hypothetical protein
LYLIFCGLNTPTTTGCDKANKFVSLSRTWCGDDGCKYLHVQFVTNFAVICVFIWNKPISQRALKLIIEMQMLIQFTLWWILFVFV